MPKVTDSHVMVFGNTPGLHQTSPSCKGEKCQDCGADATHKVIEDITWYDEQGIHMHPWTAYLCCKCFGRIMGPVVRKWCKSA